MVKAKVQLSSLLLILSLTSVQAQAQEDFDIPPPPPMEDYEEGPIDDPSYEDGDIVDGPVYEIPDGEEMPEPLTPPPGFPPAGGAPALPRNSSAPGGSQFGFSNPSSGIKSGGGGAFGNGDGKLQFRIVEGEFWEKGKKRSRANRKSE